MTNPAVRKVSAAEHVANYRRASLEAAWRDARLAKAPAERQKFGADFKKYGEPSGMTEAQFLEVWVLRGQLRFNQNGRLKDAYAMWVDTVRKRLSRPQRSSAVLTKMSGDELREHKRQQNAEAQRKRRARLKAGPGMSVPSFGAPVTGHDAYIQRLVDHLKEAEADERRSAGARP